MSTSSQAGYIVQKGLGHLWTASVAGVNGLSTVIKKAQKSYADYYEKDQLDTLRKSGKAPSQLIYEVLMKFYYLSMAGYNNEAAAAARKAAIKMAEFEKSSIPLECVLCAGEVLIDSSRKYGDFSKSTWMGIGDFLNNTRMGKDHFDRDQLVTDFYFAMLLLAESSGGVNSSFEHALRTAAGRLVEGSNFLGGPAPSPSPSPYGAPPPSSSSPYSATPASDPFNLDLLGGTMPAYAQTGAGAGGRGVGVGGGGGGYGSVPSASSYGSVPSAAAAVPSYAQVPPVTPYASVKSQTQSSSSFSSATSFFSSSPAAHTAGGGGGERGGGKTAVSAGNAEVDPKTRAAKVLYVIATSTKKAAEEAEVRRQKALKEAAEMLSKEEHKGRLG